jgi:hypothetical protein
VISRLVATALPAVGSVARSAAPPSPRLPAGCALGSNGHGDGLLLDVTAQQLFRYDVESGMRRDGIQLQLGQDPQTPGLVAVSDDGQRALVMACAEPHGDPALLQVDLAQRTASVVHRLAGRGWLVGGFANRGLIVCEQRLGEAPQFALLSLTDGGAKKLFSVAGLMQPCVPCAAQLTSSHSSEIIAFIGCLKPDALTFSGPMALCAIDRVTGAVAELTPASGTRIWAAPDRLLVEGGAEHVRVQFTTH